jgi:hypothetical protein
MRFALSEYFMEFSQAAFAVHMRNAYGLDWSRNQVAYVESRKTEPPLSELLVFGDALEVNVLDLVQHRGRVARSLGSAESMTDVLPGRAPVPQIPQKDLRPERLVPRPHGASGGGRGGGAPLRPDARRRSRTWHSSRSTFGRPPSWKNGTFARERRVAHEEGHVTEAR